MLFEEFEKAVMEKIMEKEAAVNSILREQYKHAVVKGRDFTGAGFFTDFDIPQGVFPIIEPVEYDYGDVSVIINGIYGFGFILFIENGFMVCLEGYMWVDVWPEIIDSYTLLSDEEKDRKS